MSKDDVLDFDGIIHCSFCGKGENEVSRMLAGPPGIYICNECVMICESILAEDEVGIKSTKGTGTGPKDHLPTPSELKAALDLRGICIASRWYSSFILTRSIEEEEKDYSDESGKVKTSDTNRRDHITTEDGKIVIEFENGNKAQLEKIGEAVTNIFE